MNVDTETKKECAETSDASNETSFESRFSVGCKLEARDNSGTWYAARVENIDTVNKEILIHFERWNSKFDEWIAMDSNRLRDVHKPIKRQERKFERGQKVLALWSAYQKYEATVQRALPDGKYEVLFEDGYVKRLPASKMWPLTDSSPSFKAVHDPSLGSKQDRRDRKRKLVVSELFRSNKKPKLNESVEKKTPDSPMPASPAPDESPSTVSVPPPDESPAAAQKKALPHLPSLPPTPVEVSYIDGRTETWFKSYTQRSEGKTAGKIEILFCSSAGRKFRTRGDIIRFCEENGVIYDPKLFDFSAKGRSRKFDYRPQSTVSKPTAASSAPATATTSTLPVPESPIDDASIERKFIGGLEVIVEDGQFICPLQECRKHFRKENLLHMHMKHYHPDLSKYLEYTPSVTDLAYARTMDAEAPAAAKPPIKTELRSIETKKVSVRLYTESQRLSITKSPGENPNMSPLLPSTTAEPDGAVNPDPSLGEISTDLATPKTMTSATAGPEAEPIASSSFDMEPAPSSGAIRKPKIHWKRRPYHRKQVQAADWYAEKTEKLSSSDVADGKPKDLVQRNPILNTLLNTRPLAPPLGWRPAWRRRRRGAWTKRRLPRLPLASRLTPSVTTVSPSDGYEVVEDGRHPSSAEGSDLSKSPAPTDGQKYDKLRINEIINCSCQIKEEDGLMIQCDVCLCWQHGHCLGLGPNADVPETHVCSICKDPPKGRSSMKYYNHQEWMKQGVLPTLPYSSEIVPPEVVSERQRRLKRAFDVSGQLSMLGRFLHSLRVKLNVAGNKDHPKLWLWAKKWLFSEQVKKEEPDVKEVFDDPATPKAPEPEKAIDPIECRLNLLEHIDHCYDLVQERLDALEAEITDLENTQDDALLDEPEDNCPRTSSTLRMLLKDLDTVKKIATLP